MSRLPRAYVIDASVGIKRFLREDQSAEVRTLFDRLVRDECVFVVPDLFYVECANVLWKKVVREEHPIDKAIADMEDLRALALASVPTRDLAERALEIACTHGISAYDACYVALSEQEHVPLLTADSRLASSLSGSAFDVMVLGK